jgi:MFS family permease
MKLNRKIVLVGTLVLFIVCNLIAVLTADFHVFLVVRILIGALQGLFIANAFITGISIVPPERMGQAIGIVVSGVSVATAFGVPLGTLVGQTLGRSVHHASSALAPGRPARSEPEPSAVQSSPATSDPAAGDVRTLLTTPMAGTRRRPRLGTAQARRVTSGGPPSWTASPSPRNPAPNRRSPGRPRATGPSVRVPRPRTRRRGPPTPSPARPVPRAAARLSPAHVAR